MNPFQRKLQAHSVPLTRGRFETLQINVGRKCNQICTHCHVDAGPHRTEMMTEEVARKVGAWIREHRPKTVDITGGAPELNAVGYGSTLPLTLVYNPIGAKLPPDQAELEADYKAASRSRIRNTIGI